MEIMIQASQTKGSMSGQEERDMYFARLFGLASLVQSGLLFRTLSLSYNQEKQIATQNCFEKVIQELVTLSEKKSWLRESCWWSIGLAMERIQSSLVSWREEAATQALSQLFKGAWTPEKVAIVLKLQPQYPDSDWSSILSTRFKGLEILSSKNLSTLGAILKVRFTVHLHKHPQYLCLGRTAGGRRGNQCFK
jgi:DNA polymerase phi